MNESRFSDVLHAIEDLALKLSPRGKQLIAALRARIHSIEMSSGSRLQSGISLDEEIIQELASPEITTIPGKREQIRFAVARIIGRHLFSGKGVHTSDIQHLLAHYPKRKMVYI